MLGRGVSGLSSPACLFLPVCLEMCFLRAFILLMCIANVRHRDVSMAVLSVGTCSTVGGVVCVCGGGLFLFLLLSSFCFTLLLHGFAPSCLLLFFVSVCFAFSHCLAAKWIYKCKK